MIFIVIYSVQPATFGKRHNIHPANHQVSQQRRSTTSSACFRRSVINLSALLGSADSKWNVLRRDIKPLMFLMCSLWLLLCFPHEARLWLSAPLISFWSKTIYLKKHGYFNLPDIDANQYKIILLTIVRLFLLLRHKFFCVLGVVHYTAITSQLFINI